MFKLEKKFQVIKSGITQRRGTEITQPISLSGLSRALHSDNPRAETF
jgi:hypothetical protein